MAKIIFTSHYMRDAPSAHLENYVHYISTREGIEKIDESRGQLPATEGQKKLVEQNMDLAAKRKTMWIILHTAPVWNGWESMACLQMQASR